MPTQEQINALHQLYIETTGLQLPYHMGLYHQWAHYIARGYTAADLRDVVKYLKRGIARQERREGCLKFRNLIEDLDGFAEELAMARKVLRPRPAYPPAKAQVLRATRRHDEPQQPDAQSAAVVFERTKLAAMLSAWRSANL